MTKRTFSLVLAHLIWYPAIGKRQRTDWGLALEVPVDCFPSRSITLALPRFLRAWICYKLIRLGPATRLAVAWSMIALECELLSKSSEAEGRAGNLAQAAAERSQWPSGVWTLGGGEECRQNVGLFSPASRPDSALPSASLARTGARARLPARSIWKEFRDAFALACRYRHNLTSW